ncbi:Monosaccharide-sensing protein 2 [Spatholobus suberectus]|nr:Monosaccharide-sensing protein 2 [Spatholobus suberectus]
MIRNKQKDKVLLSGYQAGLSWLAKPVTRHSSIGLASHHGSIINQTMPLMDPLVTLFGRVHEKLPETGTGSIRSTLFPNFGSMFSTAEPHVKNEQWDEEVTK